MMDFDSDSENMNDEDYYAFLNVSKEAASDEIINAYRRLSRIYHPDKHVEPEKKREAEILFNKTKKAYEVLSDAHKRAIYDSVGVRGLLTEGWQVVQYTRSPQEIRAEYERLAKERGERRLQQRTNPRGAITINVRAIELFNKYDDFEYEQDSFIPYTEISGMSFSQSVELPLTVRDTATLSGQLSTHNGTGAGGVNLSCRRLLSERGWIELEASAGNGPVISFKGFRTLTRRVFCNGATVLQFTQQGIRPGIISTLATQLDKHTVGYLTYRAGIQSSMTTSIVRDSENSLMNFTLVFGIPHSHLSINYTKKMLQRELKLRLSLKLGTFGGIVEYGAEKKVSRHSSLSAAVAVGIPTGVILKVKITRANQIYSFPIHLCEEILPAPIFYATLAPLVVYAVVKKLIVEPYIFEQKEKEKAKQREANEIKIKEKRREALAAIELMQATFARSCTDEETRRGLIIVKALYGRLPPDFKLADVDTVVNDSNLEVIDVRIPLQCLVKNSKLVLYETSKSQLPGFYDPCAGEKKSLFIYYLYRTIQHEVIIDDTESLRIPKIGHRKSL